MLSVPPSGWTTNVPPSSDTVDSIKSGDWSIRCLGGSGGCVDLDGTDGGAGLLSAGDFLLQAGGCCLLSAYVSGNQRNGNAESLTFGFTNADGTSVLESSTFNILAAVPLPAAAWLLLSGLVGFAALGRRKGAA